MSEDYRIDAANHERQPWQAHTLMEDFRLEDVWRLPVEADADQDVPMVREVLFAGLDHISSKGLAGLLFRIRMSLGELFGWDGEPETTPTLRPGSLRARYAAVKDLRVEDLPEPSGKEFSPVYIGEDETLDEIENETVHAALHLGRVPEGDSGYAIQMAIYVKPKGTLGGAYMAAIRPFRHWIVYPAMMRTIEREWKQATT